MNTTKYFGNYFRKSIKAKSLSFILQFFRLEHIKRYLCPALYMCTQGYNARKVNSSCVYSVNILKEVFLGGICKEEWMH